MAENQKTVLTEEGLKKLAAQLDAKAADGRLDLYFDVGWNRTGAQDAIYTVTVLCAGQRMVLPGGGEIAPAPTGREDYFSAVVAVWNEKGEILQIPVEKYLG